MVGSWKRPQTTLHVGVGLEHQGIRRTLHPISNRQAQVLPRDRPHYLLPDDASYTIRADHEIGQPTLILPFIVAQVNRGSAYQVALE